MTKTWLFRLIAVSIPVLFFVLLEVALRAAGYGKTTPLFIENPAAPNYLLPKPDVIKRYFADESIAPSVTIEPNFFLKTKPQDGIRIVVQGGSTAAGFPYGLGASIAGMLDYRLKQTFPEQPVEVINTALAAVNSYTLLDFADEIIEQQPDVVLIYAGHNEFLGILGAGSAYTAANSRGATLMFLKLKNLRIFQLMQNIYWAFVTPDVRQETQKSRTMMAKVAKHKNIATDSELFKHTVAQFEGNLALLLGKYQAAGIPVVISTIEANLSHQKPFSSEPYSIELQNLVDKPAGQLTATEKQTLANEAKNGVADLYFRLAQEELFLGQYQVAKNNFKLAKQHDLLRFRAPTEMNEVIRKAADREGVYLVDAQAALSSVAPNGIVGETLMLEHLHPTVKGYFAIADSFYQGLAETKLLGEYPKVVNKFEAARDLPIFDAEIYWGAAKIASLMADYPFVDSPQPVQLPPQKSWSDKLGEAAYKKQIGWMEIAKKTNQMAQKQGNVPLYLKSMKLMADAVPNDHTKTLILGLHCFRINSQIRR